MTTVKVTGKAIKLDGGRMVWLARHPEQTGSYIVRFINGEKNTEFVVSGEALDALCRLRRFVSMQGEAR